MTRPEPLSVRLAAAKRLLEWDRESRRLSQQHLAGTVYEPALDRQLAEYDDAIRAVSTAIRGATKRAAKGTK